MPSVFRSVVFTGSVAVIGCAPAFAAQETAPTMSQQAAVIAQAEIPAPDLVTTPEIQPTLLQQARAAAQSAAQAATPTQEGSAPPALAFEYSDAYRMRAKIHRIASFATLPLFATEGILGQSLYNNPSSGKKDAHLAVATGIGALFSINTVSGVWNLVEARKDSNHRGLRWAHGLLMIGADAGFLATAALGPNTEHGFNEGSRSTHRAVAFTSIGAATAGYLVMLLGGH